MAFSWVDDSAWPATEDGSWHSAALSQLRDNAQAISDERLPIGVVTFPASEPVRCCDIHASALGPFWVYLDPASGDTFDQINVIVRVDTVEYPSEANGTNAVHMHATLGDRTGYFQNPPTEYSNWDKTWQKNQSGAQTFNVYVGPEITLGWVCVYVWFHSIRRTTAEDTGTVTGYQSLGGLVLTGFALTPTDPMERAFTLEQFTDATGNVESLGRQYMIGYLDDSDTTNDIAYVYPLNTSEVGVDVVIPNWSIWECGVVPIREITVEPQAPTFQGPPAEAFYSATPVQWQNVRQLVQSIDNLIRYRVPHHMLHPGPGDSGSASSHSRMWNMFGNRIGSQITNSYQIVAATFVDEAISDTNGYKGIISILHCLNEIGAVESVNVPIQARMAVYSTAATPGGGTLLANTEIGTLSTAPLPNVERLVTDGYVPAVHHNWGPQVFGEWQGRGSLQFTDPSIIGGTHDIQLIQNIEVDIAETDITYPCFVTLEVKYIVSTVQYDSVIVGGGIVNRPLGA